MLNKLMVVNVVKVTKNNLPNILNNIETLIAENRLSKTQFYEKSGISSSLYSQWNTGTKMPSLKSLSKIADYFNIPLEVLIDGEITGHAISEEDTELMNLRQRFRENPSLRILFSATDGAPDSEILNAAAQLMRYKEQNK